MSKPAKGGTVEIVVANGKMQIKYTPELNFFGEDNFTYKVSDRPDETGLTSLLAATVTVTVNRVDDDPPVAADDSVRTDENTPVTIDVLANDRDPDQDAGLSILAVGVPKNGTATVNVPDNTITYTPNPDFLGVDSFFYSIMDGTFLTDSAMVTVTVERNVEERINRVNETVVPEVTRAIAASTLGAVTGRIEAVASGAAPAAAVNLGGASSFYHALRSNGQALEDGTLDVARFLGGSSFALSLNAAEGGKAGGLGDIGVWGSGDYRNLSGGDASAVEWDGDLVSAHLGADARLRENLLAGLSASFSKGSFDYTDRTTGTAAGGALESRMTSLNPYVSWSAREGLDLWATAGYGWGELEIADDAAAAESSDLTQWSGALGASGTLLTSDDWIAGGTTRLKLKGEGSLARVDVEGNGAAINELTVDARKVRLGLEGSHAHKLAAGGTLTPAIELGVRNDAGDGETGTGVELGGSLRYQDPETGLTVQGHGRALLTHSGNYEEWGFGGLIRLDPGADDRGLSLSLVPAWGETQSGAQRLWNDGVTDRAANDNEAQGRLQAELGYGFGVFGGAGVLTPYSGLSLAGEGARRYTLGGRLEIGPSLNLSLEAARRETAHDDAPEHGIMLRGQLRF